MRRPAIVGAVVLIAAALVPAVPSGATPAGRSLPAPAPCVGCWQPKLRVSWQWQLQQPPAKASLLDVRMYDVDGFETRPGLIRTMHRRGIKAVCYLSAGSWEDWRPDASAFPPEVLGRKNGWPGERWLDIRRLDVLRPIMRTRTAMCAAKGFDAVEYDNVDGYQNPTGFPLTGADQRRYNVFLANLAHRRSMSVLLKNDLGQVRRLLPYFDGALNEQCHQYDECGKLTPFVDAGKPVFGVEYRFTTAEFCPDANARNFNFLRKRLPLGPWREPCRGV